MTLTDTNQTDWSPIEDLPADLTTLANVEIATLASVWSEQRQSLNSSNLQEFIVRLKRQWAIETGIIERLYCLDIGITETLIVNGISASLIPHSSTDKNPETVAAMISDQYEVIDYLFDFVKGERNLSTSFIKELHSLFTQNQPTTKAKDHFGRTVDVELLRGQYKKLPNNPTRLDGSLHRYCPPEQVDSEMDNLIRLYRQHTKDNVSPEIEAAWLHHRFTQIHPFQDGNGRIARALSSLIFIKAGWLPLTVTNNDRVAYITALEHADRGDLSHLIKLFAKIQRMIFCKALAIVEQVRVKEDAQQVIYAAKELLLQQRQDLIKQWDKAKDISSALLSLSLERFRKIEENLKDAIGDIVDNLYINVQIERDGGDKSHYFRYKIITVAKELDYHANTATFHSWIKLTIKARVQSNIVLTFHGLGQQNRGIIVATVFFFNKNSPPVPASEDFFQVNYKDDTVEVQQRFSTWFEPCLVKALQMWRNSL
ncbi:MAG: Fic family protein [Nitrospirae bacterium]|nr:Fic family protein [Nitrospirota bacterium]